MSAVNKGLLQNSWKVQQQFVRYKSKINITKPRPLHFKRHVLEKLCVPYFSLKEIPQYIPPYDRCVQEEPEPVDNPFERILAREALNWFEHSEMIAFFHENECEEDEEFQNKYLLKKNGMKLLKYEDEVMRRALTNTMYEPALVLYQSETVVAVSDKPDISTLMKVNSKLPKLNLMAAIVSKKLFSFSELKELSKIPNLETAQANLLGVLSGISLKLIQNVNYYPNSVVQLLNQHQELIKEKK